MSLISVDRFKILLKLLGKGKISKKEQKSINEFGRYATFIKNDRQK